jgi:hypothetical protein
LPNTEPKPKVRVMDQRCSRPSAAAGILALALALLSCSGEPAFVRQARELEMIDAIRQQLLESVAAEKTAVLATTDEESIAAARQSSAFSAEVGRLVGELRVPIDTDGRESEREALAGFERCWQQMRTIDEQLLALAVANSDLKAARLAARDGLAAVDRFVVATQALQRATTDPETLRGLGAASAAALREEALLLIHVPVADEAEMTRLEDQMTQLTASVDATLAALRGSPLPPDGLDAAVAAWAEQRRIAAEVVRLSRENTNVRSFDVSVHQKSAATRDCVAALAALRAAVVSGPQPAR